MDSKAALALFVYNRPDHLQKMLDCLAQNVGIEDCAVYVFADGPRKNCSPEERARIEAVRSLVKNYTPFPIQAVTERSENLGLAASIITGVTEVLKKHNEVIVVEDDLELSPWFLKYMNDALALYRSAKRVISIGACNFFKPAEKGAASFFLPVPDCWGWATWKDRWEMFEPDADKLLKQLNAGNLAVDFNLHGAYNFIHLLMQQARGEVSSWAIRWQALAYLNQMVCLYPGVSHARHAGYDENATHQRGNDIGEVALAAGPTQLVYREPRVESRDYRLMQQAYQRMSPEAKKRSKRGAASLVVALIRRVLRGFTAGKRF